jgi:hypothetical protein
MHRELLNQAEKNAHHPSDDGSAGPRLRLPHQKTLRIERTNRQRVNNTATLQILRALRHLSTLSTVVQLGRFTTAFYLTGIH